MTVRITLRTNPLPANASDPQPIHREFFALHDLGAVGGKCQHHHQGDHAVHQIGFGRHAPVVGRNRRQHFRRQRIASVLAGLHVEQQRAARPRMCRAANDHLCVLSQKGHLNHFVSFNRANSKKHSTRTG
jgi:hypothetical protein